MSSRVVSLRADDSEVAAWKAVAVEQGLPFNRWARAALNDQLGLDRALVAEPSYEPFEDPA